jgi:Protein of unknown function (DUF3515)
MVHRTTLPRPVLAIVVGLPLLLAICAVAAALILGRAEAPAPPMSDAPLLLPAVPAPAAHSAQCQALVNALPSQLQSGAAALRRRPLATPAPDGTAAWGTDQPVILRCGLDRPAELTRTAELLEINGVRWLKIAGLDANSTWVAVDRPVYVALTMPDGAGTGPLQDVSTAITATLPAQPVQPAG